MESGGRPGKGGASPLVPGLHWPALATCPASERPPAPGLTGRPRCSFPGRRLACRRPCVRLALIPFPRRGGGGRATAAAAGAAAAARARLYDEVQAQPDADLWPRGLQEAGGVPVLPEWAGGRGAAGEQQSVPGPVDRPRRRDGARGGAWRSCREGGLRRGWSQRKIRQTAGHIWEPRPKAQNIRLCSYCHGNIRRLGRFC